MIYFHLISQCIGIVSFPTSIQQVRFSKLLNLLSAYSCLQYHLAIFHYHCYVHVTYKTSEFDCLPANFKFFDDAIFHALQMDGFDRKINVQTIVVSNRSDTLDFRKHWIARSNSRLLSNAHETIRLKMMLHYGPSIQTGMIYWGSL